MRLPVLALLTALSALAAPPPTLRVDYHHSGTAASEIYALDRVVREPLPWPGHPSQNLDESNLGKYLFEIRERATNRLLFSKGFASVYGEWESTEEAKRSARTFEESLRFPAPDGPVQVLLKKRDAQNAFREVWSFLLDPKDNTIQTAPPPKPSPLLELQRSGDPSDKVDLLILGEGYTLEERPKFEKDARRLMELLFAASPYKENRKAFNVWGLCPAAAQSGISRPSTGIHRRSPLGCSYDTFGSERYVLTFDNKALRDAASWAPYEFIEILVNSETYGGGGIFGQYATVAADNAYAPYLFIHEFGHHFAGLADEYYTSDVAYETGKERLEPWEPNVTADPKGGKWSSLLSQAAPLPTPWKKKAFEDYSHASQAKRRKIRAEQRPEREMDALFREEEAFETKLLGKDAHSKEVGAFEGANYEATGYYRSQEDCIMFTRDAVPFCAACRAAIQRVIKSLSR
jgi:IgA Peptidase M64/Peptidase M64 N-terminus